ncbi:GAF domain-containing protein [Herpetosiphon gulosus]|uniref:histidine kinase n=1 Tax=Herpetosiphon gulosus TaxID=1973496 RepID=A0ABP9WWD0_9CHLR
MTRPLLLSFCSATITALLFGLGWLANLPMPWILALGVVQAGIMWWRTPWAVGSAISMALIAWFAGINQVGWLALLVGGWLAQGGLPALIFILYRYPYDMSRESALNGFLASGVLFNTAISAFCMSIVGWQVGWIDEHSLVVTTALMWLTNSLGSLIITLPMLRLGTPWLSTRGWFGTPAALQRSIHRSTISRSDVLQLIFMLTIVGLIGWGIDRVAYIPVQFLNVLFLLPIVAFTARHGFDGALLSATGSMLIALSFFLDETSRMRRVGTMGNDRVAFASIVFELGVYYLISMIGGLLIDIQRAEKQRLAMLSHVNRIFNQAQKEDLLDQLVQTVCEALQTNVGIMFQYDAHGQSLKPLAWQMPKDCSIDVIATALLNYFPDLKQMTQTSASAYHHNDRTAATSTSAFWLETGLVSALLIPLVGRNGTLGLMAMFDQRPERYFGRSNINFAEAICSQAAIALEQRDLITTLQQQTEQLNAVSNITATLNATLNLEVVCHRIAQQIERVVPYDWACVALATEQTRFFSVLMKTGRAEVDLLDKTLVLSQEIWQDFGPIDAPPYRMIMNSSPVSRAAELRQIGLAVALLVPLRRDDRWLGVLVLSSFDPDAFPPAHQQLLQILARHMALAISNAQLYQELEQAYRAKQEAQDVLLQTERLRALGELSSGIAHDFNNLIAGILGHTQLLLIEAPEEQREGLAVIEQAARDGRHMVERIQQFTRAQQPEDHEMVDLNTIINDVIKLIRPRWRSRPASTMIQTRIEKGQIPLIYGSPFALREVLTNVVLNATDAMPKGGILTIRTEQVADDVIMEVSDTGIGMDEETQIRMWEPFFSTKGEHGTGLGLSMTHAIVVQHHGGRVAVQSELGTGSTISLVFPIPRPESSNDPLQVGGAQALQRGTILVVESDTRVQSALAGLLESLGHTVVCADSGTLALDLAYTRDFDALIADSGLTDINAWDLTELLKTRDPLLVAMLLTVWNAPDLDTRRHVFDAVLPKPFESQVLGETIGFLLNNRAKLANNMEN